MSKKNISVALVGNPNAGKSTIFNHLTGLRQHVSNFPGVTVDKKTGRIALDNGKKVNLIDLPGIYSLFPNSKDEKLVVDILTNPSSTHYPDFIVCVCDINSLDRHLLLATQVADLQIPMMLVLNMTDIASENGSQINTKEISQKFGVPVITCSGKSGNEVHQIKKAITDFTTNGPEDYLVKSTFYEFNSQEKTLVDSIKNSLKIENPYQAKLVMHHAEWLSHISDEQRSKMQSIVDQQDYHNVKGQIHETMSRYSSFGPIASQTLKSKAGDQLQSWTEKIDKIITHKAIGPIIFFLLMLLMFQSVYAWSSVPMDLIDASFGILSSWTRSVLPEGWFADLMVDGVIAGLGGILIFIPQITILFLLIAVLEESGYMSRAVYMFDGLMQKFGLNGRSIVALVSSGACAIPAIMSTRTIANRRERLITILVSPLISCSARIPVYTVLIGFVVAPGTVGMFNTQGLAFMGLYLLGIVASLAVAFVLKTILPADEEGSYLMMELPQYKAPMWKNVLLTVKEKVMAFVVEAGKVIFVISILLWFLASYGPSDAMQKAEQQATQMAQSQNLDEQATADFIAGKKIEASYAGHVGKFIEPAIRPLGFDWKIGISLLTSFAAREVFVGTMATIYSIGSADDEASVRDQMKKEIRPDGRPVYDFATSLSLLIFYVFALQCMSTLAITRRETNGWKWPIIQFVYMGLMAYFGSLLVYQIWS